MRDEQGGCDPVHADGVLDVVVAGASVVHAGTVADGGAWGQVGGGRVVVRRALEVEEALRGTALLDSCIGRDDAGGNVVQFCKRTWVDSPWKDRRGSGRALFVCAPGREGEVGAYL